jgi:hypothetical protein
VAGIAAPILAGLLLLGYLMKAPNSRPGQMAYAPANPPVAPAVSEPAPKAPPNPGSLRTVRHAEHTPKRAVPNNSIARPKLDVFPTPEPLTAEEQAMTRFAAQASEADRKALLAAQQQADEPLTISAIRIPPIESVDENH